MRITVVVSSILIFLSFAIGIYYYGSLPEEIASHWNADGEVDGYMNKFWGLFLMPLVASGILVLFIVIPKIDPLRDNIRLFRKHFDGFILVIISFLFYIYLVSLFWNLGYTFDMNLAILPAMGIMFFYAGNLMGNAKRNWFIGVRNPWTLSSDVVWNKTHKRGGILFKALGIIFVLSAFFEQINIFFILIFVLFVVVYLFIYSYVEYRKLKK